jgi:two-component system response regulator FixJ
MMTSTPVVFVVDDDPGIRRSTGLMLDAAGLSYESFERAVDFLDAYDPQRPGCLIVDLSMPGMCGMDMVRQLRARNLQIPIVIVSGTGTIPLVVQGLKLGVVDFFEKPTNPEELLDKVRKALEMDSEQRVHEAELGPIRAKFNSLTARERELLEMLVRGWLSKQIAVKLGISIKTVENHRANLMIKTGALNVADLTRLAIRVGASSSTAY